MGKPMSTELNNDLKFIIFKIKNHLFGLNIDKMKEVNQIMNVAPVPLAPPEISGMINLRSVIITVIDLSILLGLGSHIFTTSSHNIIFKNNPVALLVEDVLDIRTILANEIHDVPADFGGIEQKYLSGILEKNNEIILILSAPTLLEVKE